MNWPLSIAAAVAAQVVVVVTESELYDDATRCYRVVEAGGWGGGGAGHTFALPDRGQLLLPRTERVRGDSGPIPVLTEHRAVLGPTLVAFCVTLHSGKRRKHFHLKHIKFFTFPNLPAFLYIYI